MKRINIHFPEVEFRIEGITRYEPIRDKIIIGLKQLWAVSEITGFPIETVLARSLAHEYCHYLDLADVDRRFFQRLERLEWRANQFSFQDEIATEFIVGLILRQRKREERLRLWLRLLLVMAFILWVVAVFLL